MATGDGPVKRIKGGPQFVCQNPEVTNKTIRVMLVGDGVNDAPALAAADLGVAMGRKCSDLALRSADAVLVRDGLNALPAVIALSRRAHRIAKANQRPTRAGSVS